MTNRLDAVATSCKIGVAINEGKGPDMTIIEAMRASAKRHGVSEGDVLGHTRKPHIVKARWAGWAKAVEAGHTRADIARAVGRDWTSVMHGVRRYNEGKDT